jgi:hypothetical protein
MSALEVPPFRNWLPDTALYSLRITGAAEAMLRQSKRQQNEGTNRFFNIFITIPSIPLITATPLLSLPGHIDP